MFIQFIKKLIYHEDITILSFTTLLNIIIRDYNELQENNNSSFQEKTTLLFTLWLNNNFIFMLWFVNGYDIGFWIRIKKKPCQNAMDFKVSD